MTGAVGHSRIIFLPQTGVLSELCVRVHVGTKPAELLTRRPWFPRVLTKIPPKKAGSASSTAFRNSALRRGHLGSYR